MWQNVQTFILHQFNISEPVFEVPPILKYHCLHPIEWSLKTGHTMSWLLYNQYLEKGEFLPPNRARPPDFSDPNHQIKE